MEFIGGLAIAALFALAAAVGVKAKKNPRTLTADEEDLEREWMQSIR